MTPGHVLALLGIGVAAGVINTVVGSGSLVTFPVLLALGYNPLPANVINKLGLTPGNVTGTIGYRRELRGLARLAVTLAALAAVGGVIGAVLLLNLPESIFNSVVPWLLLAACALVLVQPTVKKLLARSGGGIVKGSGAVVRVGAFLVAIYGGYFGGGQGVILLSLLGLTVRQDLQRLNAVKNVLAATANVVGSIVFCVVASVVWSAVAVMACGAIIGGFLGARIGRRLPPGKLRLVVVAIGVIAAIKLMV